jgi:hypothetical protein
MILLTDTIFIKKENYATQIKRVNIEDITWDTLKNGVYTHEFLNEIGTDECGGDICRLFFDIDAKYDKSSKTNIFDKHAQIIGVLTKNASRHNFVFTDGSYENDDKYTKLSFHIIFQDKYIHKPSLTNLSTISTIASTKNTPYFVFHTEPKKENWQFTNPCVIQNHTVTLLKISRQNHTV